MARAAWSYVWACIWMLGGGKSRPRQNFPDEKTVSLNIPKSKMDQEGKGVTRTLGCCGRQSCTRFCPVLMTKRALGGLKGAPNSCQLFPSERRTQVTKTQMIKSWRTAVNPNLSGHSARRSGAMMYTREGLAIQEISFLGRWKSSAVFRYMEEAMEPVAVNRREGNPVTVVAAEEVKMQDGQQKGHTSPADPPERNQFEVYKNADRAKTEENELWILSKARGKAVAHHIGQASWNIPLDEWSTRCGWTFAKRNVKVSITKWKPKDGQECKKCLELKFLRDGVKGARELAHKMCWPEAKMKRLKAL